MNAEIQEFILENIAENISDISLKISKQKDWPREYILNQINGWQKAKKKFPFLKDFPNFQFPVAKSVSQSSSEATAEFKSKLIKGQSSLDLTGGMGIDSYFFSKEFKQHAYNELNPALYSLTKENFEALVATNITCSQKTAEELLLNWTEKVDLIYLDPDRRPGKGKAFLPEDCLPNVLELLPRIFELADHCLIKFSPMLDLKEAKRLFPNCHTIHVLEWESECKEVLLMLGKSETEDCEIHAIDLMHKNSSFSFNQAEEDAIQIQHELALPYLYVPNAAVSKSAGYKSLAKQFNVSKVAANTHIYSSKELISTFPGRAFELIKEVKGNEIKKSTMHVIAKNYPLNAQQLQAKFKLKSSGENFLLAFSGIKKKHLFHTRLIN